MNVSEVSAKSMEVTTQRNDELVIETHTLRKRGYSIQKPLESMLYLLLRVGRPLALRCVVPRLCFDVNEAPGHSR